MPADVAEYREPFVGGGGVFFAIPTVKVAKRWINDIHPGLVAVYTALRDSPVEFIAACRAVEPQRKGEPLSPSGTGNGRPMNARLSGVFDSVRLNPDCDQAFRYFFVNRTVFAGRVNYDRPSRLYFSKPEGWDIAHAAGRLEAAARHMRGVDITCGDYEMLFSKPGDGVWIYADPPYVVNDDAHGNSKLYQHCFTLDDHRRLAKAVSGCRHRVAVSYDDDPGGVVRSLYASPRFRVVERQWAYNGSTLGVKKRGRELLILNYDPPRFDLGLFDLAPASAVPADGTLAEYEAVIDRCANSFAVMGEALQVIRDRDKWREGGYESFDAYCTTRWGLTPQHANRLVASSRVANLLQLEPTGSESKSFSERHARELARLKGPDGDLDEGLIASTWREVESRVAGGTPLTAELVREEVVRVIGPRHGHPSGDALGSLKRLVKKRLAGLSPADRKRFFRWLRSGAVTNGKAGGS